jgi:DNA modification methylase
MSREPVLCSDGVTIYRGDALAVMREMDAESVDCVLTSPPYW